MHNDICPNIVNAMADVLDIRQNSRNILLASIFIVALNFLNKKIQNYKKFKRILKNNLLAI